MAIEMMEYANNSDNILEVYNLKKYYPISKFVLGKSRSMSRLLMMFHFPLNGEPRWGL